MQCSYMLKYIERISGLSLAQGYKLRRVVGSLEVSEFSEWKAHFFFTHLRRELT